MRESSEEFVLLVSKLFDNLRKDSLNTGQVIGALKIRSISQPPKTRRSNDAP
jgi:hypothetical protein